MLFIQATNRRTNVENDDMVRDENTACLIGRMSHKVVTHLLLQQVKIRCKLNVNVTCYRTHCENDSRHINVVLYFVRLELYHSVFSK